MRTTTSIRPLDALLGVTRQKILAQTYRRPERWWYLHELARSLRLRPSSLQRDLSILAAAGILLRRRQGNRVYYRANESLPIFPEIRQLLLKTIALADVLKEALGPLASKIQAAFIYGSVAASQERSTSDVDLFIVGDLRLAEVATALRGLDARLGRSVHPTVYTPAEFRSKRRRGHSFVKNVVEGKKLFLFGTDDDLE
jgi:DNA-binding transcriptional ArsR family regulator